MKFWCQRAILDGGVVAHSVVVDSDGGVITALSPDTPPPPGAEQLTGMVIAGLGNAHSHAFHRALRARTQTDRGTFWTWRELMYSAAERLTPESYRRLARAVYAEMALAGITSVGEFHYLHHDRDGRPYADPNAMGHALIDAAADAGIRITLLDACYLTAAVNGSPLAAGPQQRFGDGSVQNWAARVELLAAEPPRPHAKVGAAIHSVRAVAREDMPVVARWAAAHHAPLHVHACEQLAEIDACQAFYGQSPIEVLDHAGALGPSTTVVHATHLRDHDIALLRDTATGVCFCPTTERDLGDGIGPAAPLLDNPGHFCLGSDSQAMIDLFEESRAVELDERLRTMRRGNFEATRLLTAAARDGQLALGWHDAGSIAVGMRTDLVALDMGSVRTAGCGFSPETVVFAASAADVTDVVVDGEFVVRARRHTLVDDPAGQLAVEIDALTSRTGVLR
ncbi:formimidoylglutamate deiminase [Gordonia jinhuaensis]|uniref:Formimidoylglutamate deiminase n=1 Tax=Gordonia jinhuaensis TaxID=1517702 RepID=A0A916SY50_9ACTN|nr:formimidoylglutamate deiminase [Gordonia jinhuaensis]GGB22917.1 formimidoylglutamate deiminase [Gordonia jinhuaensis]